MSNPNVSGRRDRRSACLSAIERGSGWLADVAQITGPSRMFDDPKHYPHSDYTGAMRTEYDTRTQVWSINGPAFHTGQAIRALLVAARRLRSERLEDAARLGASFLLREQISEEGHPHQGLLLSLEQNHDEVNIQVTLEALSGLIDLYDWTGDRRYLQVVQKNADLLIEHAYLPDERLMMDHYSLGRRGFIGDAENDLPGRAMVDDAVLLKLADRTGDDRYRRIFLSMADRLIEEEGPPGTWLRFPPWRPDECRIHGRKNWWWGYPLLAAFDATGDVRYLHAGKRAGDWYLEQQNLDGGLYYTPSPDRRHNSFGICTSVVACAVLYWTDLSKRLGDDKYLDGINRGVGFLLSAQFSQDVDDENVRGAFFESPHPPDGSLGARVSRTGYRDNLFDQGARCCSGDSEFDRSIWGSVRHLHGMVANATPFHSSFRVEPKLANITFTSLEPRTYFLACDLPTASGVEHVELGMVAEFVVE